MRILYVNPFAQQVSGPDESLIGLIESLRGSIEPVVALPPGNPHVRRYEQAGATVINQSMQRIRRTASPVALAAYFGLFVPEALRLARLIRRMKIDLVHTNMEVVLQSGMAARLTATPSVYHVRGTSFAHPVWARDAVVSAIDKFSDRIIVISRAVGEIFYQRGIREKIEVVHNSLDPASFDVAREEIVASTRDELTRGASGLLVATVCRINPRKGLECFIEAAALVARAHPEARFAIIGDAADDFEKAYLGRLQQIAAHAGVSHKLVFAPARRDIAELMKAIDVFVTTSINEGFGRVAIEAMAARRAVVASNVGGLPEIVEDQITGRLAPANQPAAFAAAICDLLSDAETRSRMGAQGRRRVEACFSHDALAPAVTRIYDQVLSSHRATRAAVAAP